MCHRCNCCTTEVFRTAKAWMDRGYIVKRYAKSFRRNCDGTAVFRRSQVRPL